MLQVDVINCQTDQRQVTQGEFAQLAVCGSQISIKYLTNNQLKYNNQKKSNDMCMFKKNSIHFKIMKKLKCSAYKNL